MTQRYQEPFDENWQYLMDYRCWQSDNLHGASVASGPETDPEQTDPELLIRPGSKQSVWSASTQAPMVFRESSQDFVVLTRVEAASGFMDSCLGAQDRAGLVVRGAAGWATFLSQPDVAASAVICADDDKPPARVFRQSLGFGAALDEQGPTFGLDGEADIALCRLSGQLVYYYRDRTENGVEGWRELGRHSVDTGRLDVGVTATSSGNVGSSGGAGVEGHFAWLGFLEGLIGDGCSGALDAFNSWEP